MLRVYLRLETGSTLSSPPKMKRWCVMSLSTAGPPKSQGTGCTRLQASWDTKREVGPLTDCVLHGDPAHDIFYARLALLQESRPEDHRQVERAHFVDVALGGESAAVRHTQMQRGG